MSSQQGFNLRGYMYISGVDFLRRTIGNSEAKRAVGSFSPEAWHLLDTLESADWCPVSVFSEVLQVIGKAGGGGERSHELLVTCGTDVAREARLHPGQAGHGRLHGSLRALSLLMEAIGVERHSSPQSNG